MLCCRTAAILTEIAEPAGGAESRSTSDLRLLSLLVIGVLLLGFGPWMVRLSGLDGAASAFWRLSTAVIPLLLIMQLTGDRLRSLPLSLLGGMAAAGTLYGLGMILMNASVLRTSLANCALIGNFSSFMVAGIALAERKTAERGAVLSLLLALGGLVLLLGPSTTISTDSVAGDLLALAAATLFTGYFLILFRIPRRARPLTVHAVATSSGSLVVVPFLLGSNLTPEQWWPVFVLGCGQVVGQGLVVYTVPRLPPILGGLAILLFPLVNMAIGWLWYDEAMTGVQLGGALLIIAALALLQIRRGPV